MADYFVFNRNAIVYPLLLGNFYKNGKIRIRLSEKGNLLADSRHLK